MRSLPIRLYFLSASASWALAFWPGGQVVRVVHGFATKELAIARANDVCAGMGMLPQFVK